MKKGKENAGDYYCILVMHMKETYMDKRIPVSGDYNYQRFENIHYEGTNNATSHLYVRNLVIDESSTDDEENKEDLGELMFASTQDW